MAEEDLIFGKNRHFFGGIEPSHMSVFKASQYIDDNNNPCMRIKATLPSDTVFSNQTLCTVAGAVIRRRTDRYPENEFDGDFIADISNNCVIMDNNVEYNKTYYYSAFPYSKQGVYNRSSKNRTSFQIEEYYYFGFDMDTTNSDPDANVTYPSDVQNASYDPAYMDFDHGVFNYGSWPSEGGKYFMPRPVVLRCDVNGNVDIPDDGYLDENDYASGEPGRYIDGSLDDETYFYNVMMQWPKIYMHREITEDGVYKFRCSDRKLGDDWDCYCNYNLNGEEIDHFYTPVYNGCDKSILNTDTIAVRSISGVIPNNARTGVYTKIDSMILGVQNNNQGEQKGWNIETMTDRFLIQDLLVLMAKSTNTQVSYGNGYYTSSASSMTLENGTLNDKGLFYGYDNYKHGVKVFGMENWWGYMGRATSGLLIDHNEDGDGKPYMYLSNSLNYSIKDVEYPTHTLIRLKDLYPKTTSTYDYLFTSDYMSSYAGGYGCVKPFGRIPYIKGGSKSTYEADYIHICAPGTNTNSAVFLSCGTGSIYYNSGTSVNNDSEPYAGAFAMCFMAKASDSLSNMPKIYACPSFRPYQGAAG